MTTGPQRPDNNRLLLALLVSALVVVGFDYVRLRFWAPPVPPAVTAPAADATGPGAPSLTAVGGAAPAAPGVSLPDEAHARVPLKTQSFDGSVALLGGRIDTLTLVNYRVAAGSDEREKLFTPTGAHVHFFEAGWLSESAATPDGNTLWQTDGQDLRPDTPLTLTWKNGQGQTFQRRYILNPDGYTVQVIDAVTNEGAAPVRLTHYAQLHRAGVNYKETSFYNFNGVQAFLDGVHHEFSYDDLRKQSSTQAGRNGWVGISQPYFMAAIVPDQVETITVTARHTKVGEKDYYSADVQSPLKTLNPGEYYETTYRLYAGPKRVATLAKEGAGLEKVVDFGWFHVIAKLFFDGLVGLGKLVGNMGWAIVIMTVLIKLALFPLANKSYRAMSEMKKLQPKMEEIRNRVGDDRDKMAMEMMALYRNHKVNPMSGCWPVLIQIPIFFAFYKVILIAFEFRQAPFVGWIVDLSVKDPFYVLPILMGITMIIQQRLNPPAMDPIQQRVLQFLPVLFTVMFLMFPAGLVLYWFTNNLLSIAQQWWIMRRMGVKA